jgi:phosphatidylinositol glycan class V
MHAEHEVAPHVCAGLSRWLPLDAVYTLAGLAISVAAFCIAALCLHRLGRRVLMSGSRGSGRAAASSHTADVALLLFCCNPASVFYSAAYSEALFAACTWAALLLLPHHHWAGVAALTAAAAARSNGLLGLWFPLHKLLSTWFQRGGASLGEMARTLASCCLILTPYIGMQGKARRVRQA